MKGFSVKQVLTCLVCGVETDVTGVFTVWITFESCLTDVIISCDESNVTGEKGVFVTGVPLKKIAEKSCLAERLLCTDLDWKKGIQVNIYKLYTCIMIKMSMNVITRL